MKIKKIFEELKKNQHIKKSRYLKPSDKFEAGIFKLNKIEFPSKGSGKNIGKLSDNSKRWALLHEEAHLSNFKGQHYFFWGLMIYAIFLIFIYLLSIFSMINLPLTYIYSSVPTIYSIGCILSHSYLHKTEEKCDKFASYIMKEHYKIDKPSHLLKEMEEWYNQEQQIENKNKVIYKKIGSLIKNPLSPHIPWCQRAKKIKEWEEI